MSEQEGWKVRLSKVPQGLDVIVSLDSNTREFKVEFEERVVSQSPRVKRETCFYCGEEGHKVVNCSLRNKDRRLRSKRNLGDLKLHLGPSSPHESQSATFCDNCGVIGLPAGHECSGVKALLESLVEGFDGKLSAETEKVTSAGSSSN
ncbi:hypothetical protein Mp_3g20330 [Marchantia polymorpha subsp. ruderalis]|uniref:CCHC-type domain-containing protein n=1 Tax=Marchantia polymorpha subsp. ruderalis TaxID=1480154 RepID=A0AAF6B2W2_MARPO|nr:hypothetical protein Mp_1g06920 [Marchantia polymorpha subsp. ruderalis]BBM97842.1 hypothetical protein Mp_1g08770 [Marchantia polymorpha subsp. ruderalis]BBN02450.1 hypothetical protein Mp_2g15480 [Marchantia polymorpha subsp. ruderalis]BBN02688.1 hypothetical protein Mp_2g17250 [Marchantia polymorpha subsp. ruderalis]BBN06346.1 hypothetical protein Mp_3g20330 [Marchantia polymorpha subsp. ruderalis]